jgi:hypothetical protein
MSAFVKSAKERSLEAFTSHIKNLRSFMKQRDFKKIQSEFEELSKAMLKAKKALLPEFSSAGSDFS